MKEGALPPSLPPPRTSPAQAPEFGERIRKKAGTAPTQEKPRSEQTRFWEHRAHRTSGGRLLAVDSESKTGYSKNSGCPFFTFGSAVFIADRWSSGSAANPDVLPVPHLFGFERAGAKAGVLKLNPASLSPRRSPPLPNGTFPDAACRFDG